MKKRVIIIASLVAVKVLALVSANVTVLWAFIEFILYLVKDKHFNWWSVWTFIISIIVSILSVGVAVYCKNKLKFELEDEIESHKPVRSKSRFQQRLDEAMNRNN